MKFPSRPLVSFLNVNRSIFLPFSALLLGCITGGDSVAWAQAAFERPTAHPEPGFAYSVALADFNGNGRTDVANARSASPDGWGIFVFGGNTDGSLSKLAEIPVTAPQVFGSPAPLFLQARDMNGDGKADLVARAAGTTAVISFAGNGDGTFQTGVIASLSDLSSTFKAGDVNGDGKGDLVTVPANPQGNPESRVSIYVGNGDGSFQPKTDHPVATAPADLFLVDLNGDGRDDIVTVPKESHALTALISAGTGGYHPVDLSTGPNTWVGSVTAFDYNGDGAKDIVASAGGGLVVFLNGGDGSFPQRVEHLGEDAPAGSLFLMDLNGNARPDLLAGKYNALSLHTDPGDGTYRRPQSFGFNGVTGFEVLGPGDIDGDGDADLFLKVGIQIQVMLNRRNARPLAPPRFSPLAELPLSFPAALETADLDGNGSDDIVMAATSDSSVQVALSNGDGTFKPLTGYDMGRRTRFIRLADLNGDGKTDIVVTHPDYPQSTGGRTVGVFLNKGDGTFHTQSNHPVGGNPEAVAVGDFNKDGKADLAVVCVAPEPANNKVSILLNQGEGFAAKVEYNLSGTYHTVQAADLNGDANLDLALEKYPPGSGAGIMFGSGDGAFGPLTESAGGLAESVLYPHADFNGDGRADLYTPVPAPHSTQVELRLSQESGSKSRIYATPDFVTSAVAGDFNNDGRIDLLVGNDSSNQQSSFLLGYGDGAFAFEAAPLPAGTPFKTADFNGDGRPDLLATRNDGYGKVIVAINETPDLALFVKPAARAGEAVQLTVIPNRPLSAPPVVKLSAPCVDAADIPVSATEEAPGIYTGVYKVPAGATDCTAALTATGSRAPDAAVLTGSAAMIIDRTPPEVQITAMGQTNNGKFYKDDVELTLTSSDATSGVQTLFHGINRPSCTADHPENCAASQATAEGPPSPRYNLTPEADYTITGFARDAAGNVSPPATRTFRLDRTPPTAESQNVTTAEDQPVEITLTGTDNLPGPLSFSIQGEPRNGTLSFIVGGRVTYTPKPNFFGADSFTFRANDGAYTSTASTVSITVTPVEDTPGAKDLAFVVIKERPFPFTLPVKDSDGDSLAYTFLVQPQYGALTGTPPDMTYTPRPGYLGSDLIVFQTQDGQTVAGPASISLNVIDPVLLLSDAAAEPGASATFTLSAPNLPKTLKSIRLHLKWDALAVPPALLQPSYDVGAATTGWAVEADPADPMGVVLSRQGTEFGGSGELLKVAFTLPAVSVPGTILMLQTDVASIVSETDSTADVTSQAVPGRLTVQTPTCAPVMKGDLSSDGKIDISDAVITLRTVVGLHEPGDACHFLAADVNCDGSVMVDDAILILRAIAFGDALSPCP